jgi:hypothetical protein
VGSSGTQVLTGTASRPATDRGDQAEFSFRLPGGPVHTWRWRAPRVELTRIGLALIALHLVLTGTRLARSWWWQDDLYMFGLVADRNLTPGLVLSDYNGHLEPASFVLGWLMTHLAPYAWWLGAVTQFSMLAAIDLVFFALLLRMFGRRPAILVPLAMFCATSLTLAGTLWWSAAMQWLPTTLCLALCLYFHVGYLATGARRQAVGAVCSLVGGLLFFEKALTALAVIAFLTLAYYTPGSWWRRPVRALVRHRAYWGAFAGVTVVYLTLYFLRTTVTSSEVGGAGRVAKLAREAVLYDYLPGLFGGPLRWGGVPGEVTTWSSPSDTVVWLSAILFGALVLGSLWAGRSRRLRRIGSRRSLGARSPLAAWTLLTLFVGLTIGLIARTRLGVAGPFIGRDHRYLTDAALMGPLCLALAWLPLRHSPAAAETTPADDPGDSDGGEPPARRRWVLLSLGTVFVLVITTCGAISGERFMRTWSQNTTDEYLTNLRGDLDAAEGPVTMFDQAVPTSMMMASFEHGAMLSHVTKPFPKRPQFVTWAPAVKVVDPEGHVHDGKVRGVTAPGKQSACNRGQATAVARRLPARPMKWVWKVQIAYMANRDTRALISLDDGKPGAETVPVRLTAGVHFVFVSLLGGGDRVVVSGLEPGAAVCLAEVSVGGIVPAD